ncbi:hypothetical protein, partial [Mesorhizobium sp. M1D.F.Ca.ET.183.01.1.1]
VEFVARVMNKSGKFHLPAVRRLPYYDGYTPLFYPSFRGIEDAKQRIGATAMQGLDPMGKGSRRPRY